MTKGRLFLALSAVTYGIIPALAAAAYRGGMNGITLTFLRSALSLPVLYAVIRADRRGIRLDRKRIRQVMVLGVFGGALPILLLYMSYQYIATGLATALHFVYPLVIVVATSIIYRQRPARITVTAATIVSAGIFIYAGMGSGASGAGVALALLSGVFYGFYVVYMARTGMDKLDIVVITFYVALITSALVLVYGAASGRLYFNITPLSWSLAFVISLASTLIAAPLFVLGMRYSGAAEAGIYSTLEPVTSMILGAAALGELMDAPKLLGGALIVFGVLIIQRKKINIK